MNYSDLVRDFATRTRDNLKFIDDAKERGDRVYEVTQLVNSLLGLIVLPRETHIKFPKGTTWGDLKTKGWPNRVLGHANGTPKNPNDLLRLLRNSVAHFNIEFHAPPGGDIESLTLSNKCGAGNKTWEVRLTVDELRQLTKCYLNLILSSMQPASAKPSKSKPKPA